ncbi:hypothetical protein [Bradyrhizobium valentinum]|uniref:Uncharacterized protein n=1 Tax=Bradyrhizobium valentinum TaxID=1518501 RepID=A0A0R3KFU7_9BRAD|nr:hypothetical protein [Bradyrhizobium valentinum]KRQ94467.1 hypothetical protein CQ10_34070 [Bradyrhizobium valentinum]KRR10552.1 hypothetical protein CP49_12280 [Bradyrhizobium valentinum]
MRILPACAVATTAQRPPGPPSRLAHAHEGADANEGWVVQIGFLGAASYVCFRFDIAIVVCILEEIDGDNWY